MLHQRCSSAMSTVGLLQTSGYEGDRERESEGWREKERGREKEKKRSQEQFEGEV